MGEVVQKRELNSHKHCSQLVRPETNTGGCRILRVKNICPESGAGDYSLGLTAVPQQYLFGISRMHELQHREIFNSCIWGLLESFGSGTFCAYPGASHLDDPINQLCLARLDCCCYFLEHVQPTTISTTAVPVTAVAGAASTAASAIMASLSAALLALRTAGQPRHQS